MKFGSAAWGFRETPLEEQLRITHDLGMQFLELGIANAPADLALDATRQELERVRELYRDYGIELQYASTGNDFSQGHDKDVQKVEKVLDICSALGVKYLRIFAGFSPLEEVTGSRWKNMVDCIGKVDDYAGRRNVCLVIETHGGVNSYEDGVEHFASTSTDPEALRKLMKELPDTVKLLFDPANLWAVGDPHPENIYKMFQERIPVVHMKDFVPQPSGHIKPGACGEGIMDWALILDAMRDFGGAVLFEYENPWDIKEGLRKSYEYINENMQQNIYNRQQKMLVK